MNSRRWCRSLGLAVAGALASAKAAEPSACAARLVLPESQDVRCPLDPSALGRPMRFVAQFTGSHDDTRLGLTATLDGRPLICAPGSRTSLVAEDGEVSLDCRFRIDPRTTQPVLEVALSVHHAQYLSAEVVHE